MDMDKLINDWRLFGVALLIIILNIIIYRIKFRKPKLYKKLLQRIDFTVDLKPNVTFAIYARALKTYANSYTSLTQDEQLEISKNSEKYQTLLCNDNVTGNRKMTKVCVRRYKVNRTDALHTHLLKIYAKKFNHPNLCKILHSFVVVDDEQQTMNMFIVEEFVNGTPLNILIENINEHHDEQISQEKLACIAKQCLRALDYLYQQDLMLESLQTKHIIIDADDSLRLVSIQNWQPFIDRKTQAKMMAKIMGDLQAVLLEMKKVTVKVGKEFDSFMKSLKKERDIARLLEHDFLQKACVFGPKGKN